MAPFNLDNIQGDILQGFAKKTETYLFFDIGDDVNLFRKKLTQLVPLISSATQVANDRAGIARHRAERRPGLFHCVGVNISFSQLGLAKMGIDDLKSDTVFASGQKADAGSLGDPGSGDPTSPDFVPAWHKAFLDGVDGVILVAGDSHDSVSKALDKVTHIFGSSIKKELRLRGDVRPKDQHGHEHFGFADGISNPAVKEFDTKPFPGQETVGQNIIFTGRDSDTTPPPLLVDGSFLVFRWLSQRVPEFDDFLFKHPIIAPGLSHKEGSEFMGARLVGRWKSGAPLDLAPLRDDKKLGADPNRNNDFRYAGELAANNQERCPYSAHVRKTNPRADLEDHAPRPIPTEPQRIIRRGIPFGPEVTESEKEEARTKHDRGLLFTSYQSSITNGFQFIQRSWANNEGFIFGIPNDPDFKPGFDSIIGQPPDRGAIRITRGTDPKVPHGDLQLPNLFVIPKGGEYFFTPSISALRDVIAFAVEIEES